MEQRLAERIAEAYERWGATGDESVKVLFSEDFLDNVSGQRGLAIGTTSGCSSRSATPGRAESPSPERRSRNV